VFILASLGLTKKLSVLEPILILLTCRLYRLSDTIDYMERKKPSLREIFSPHGIAVVGASSSGESSFATMVDLGNPRRVLPVKFELQAPQGGCLFRFAAS